MDGTGAQAQHSNVRALMLSEWVGGGGIMEKGRHGLDELMGGDGGRRAEVKEKRTTCNGVDDSGSSSRLGHLQRRDRQPGKACY